MGILNADGSNDKTDIKDLNPVQIPLFNDNKGKVSAQLLDMWSCKEGTVKSLFNNIDSILRENKAD